MTSTELVGPLPTVTFGGGPRIPISEWGARPKVAYVPPRNTMDPRFDACTDHHVACDCREAEHAEMLQEWRSERQESDDAFAQILAGHATYAWSVYRRTVVGWVGDSPVEKFAEIPEQLCMCTGCQIARAVHYYPRGEA